MSDGNTLKATLDSDALVKISAGDGTTIVSAWRKDGWYIFAGPAGRHSLDADRTDADRLAAHWRGFADISIKAAGR